MYKRISFTIPNNLALTLKERVNEGEQSHFIREAIEVKLLERELEKDVIYSKLKQLRARIKKVPHKNIIDSIKKGRL